MGLTDTHSVFCWETANVNKKTPQDTVPLKSLHRMKNFYPDMIK